MNNYFNPKKISWLVIMLFAFLPGIHAQVTTATISGIVRSPKGEPLPAATVKVEYPDAGISQSLVTRSDGRFTVPNLRVGGPYKITVNHISHQAAVSENIFLELGLNNTVEFKLEEKSTELTGVTVLTRSAIFDDKRTGASTNISSRQLKTLPTISRSADDFLRLTPSASANYNGISFAGRNGLEWALPAVKISGAEWLLLRSTRKKRVSWWATWTKYTNRPSG